MTENSGVAAVTSNYSPDAGNGTNDGQKQPIKEEGENNYASNQLSVTDEEKSQDVEQEQYGFDDDMCEEYREMLDELGAFPDKVKINTLSMIAEDHSSSPTSSKNLYTLIRTPLLSPTLNPQRKLPLVYVIDSILKNVGGCFITHIEDDAKHWLPVVFSTKVGSHQQNETVKAKLKKVWNTWKDANLFKEEVWRDMGQCFDEEVNNTQQQSNDGAASSPSFESIPLHVRKQMQVILDELTSDEDELDKVSLERLSNINPTLFANIKKAALDALTSSSSTGANKTGGNVNAAPLHHPGGVASAVTGNVDDDDDYPSPFGETRPLEVIRASKEWSRTDFTLEKARDLITSLQKHVREGSLRDGEVCDGRTPLRLAAAG
eukprot:CAMPEP_0172510946 /NCGR_PEP_ID=MMETSP1066-20121228/232570_1 /TAXON_ID=671091 /ORGANISM="Coscinodiscus wailesii, Strain CCMP2513" /LENGTH=375 /DNA_ID=CAMNT_0013290127 /DNA_START=18 /DNA_END=1141 /DNA_ORIENTATION=+